MISKLAIAGLVGVGLLLGTLATASADSPRVVLVQPDPALASAVRTALVPWRIAVVDVDIELPPRDMIGAARSARQIARERNAGAVVWLSIDPKRDTAVLWVYDLADNQIIARGINGMPPFDAAAAAAAALSVKTLLRHSAVAPPRERLAMPRPSRRFATLRFETTTGLRVRRTEANDIEARLGFGPVWWPSWLGGRFGATMQLESGPGISISEGFFIGRFTDTTASASVRARFQTGSWKLEPEFGSALHFTSLDGAVLAPEEAASITRNNVSIDAGLTVARVLGDNVELGLRLRGAALVEAQRYLVQGTPILTLPRTELDIAIVFGAGIF